MRSGYCLVAAALALLSACSRAPQVTAEDAVVTLPALAGQPGAAYFRLEASSPAERLLRVETPAAERVELHQNRTDAGVSAMTPLPSPAFDRDGTLAFTPGGRHAMLFGLKPGLAPGGRTTITFVFETAPPVTVEAEVRAPGMGHSDH